MKKFISVSLSLLLLTSILASCSDMGNESTTNDAGTEETTQNLSVSGNENLLKDQNTATTDQDTSDTLSFG